MTIVPLSNFSGRMPEAGRLRLGVKTGAAMKSIDTFRFTSPREDLIRKAAEVYGAKQGPRPWSDAKASVKDQWEVITQASTIRVYLPPGALSCSYEQWSGGGCVRRCDGEMCETVLGRGEAAEITSVPCLCEREQKLSCKPTSRLSVILPDLPFAGTWRLESKGWNALHELNGMETMIASIQAKAGVIEADLSVVERSTMVNGRKKHFVVPVLALSKSVLELASGMADIRAIAQGVAPPAQLGAGEPHEPLPMTNPVDAAVAPAWDDDEIVDAELVETPTDPTSELHEAVLSLASDLSHHDSGRDDDPTVILSAYVQWASRRRKRNFDDLTDKQRGAVLAAMRDTLANKVSPVVTDEGLNLEPRRV